MKKKVFAKGLGVILVLAMLLSVAAVNISGAQAARNPETAKYFIGFTTTPGPAEEALVRAFGGTVRHTYHIVPAISAELPVSAIAGLQRNPNVTIIEPVIKAYLVEVSQEKLDEELNDTWGVKHIGAGQVHCDGYLGAGIKVAVIDSGIDYEHSDLKDNYKGGYDFADKNDNPMDVHSHGTHVAGTVAAIRDGVGVVGVAPEAELYALKVFGDDESAYYDDIIAAINWAAENGIQVTNNSYGSIGYPGTLVEEAFDNAYYNEGVLHVAAAGNSGNRGGGGDNVIYPARFASVIAVAASDSNNRRASFSSTGPNVELIAPGVSIYSTILNGKYGNKSGTSMASPHVAGVAALVLAANPQLTNEEVRVILQDTAQNLGLSANHQGYGLVRADNAVAAVPETEPTAKGSIAGKVIDAEETPINEATIVVEGTVFSATTNEEGYYRIEGVPVGSYDVTASADGYDSQTVPVEVEKDKSVTRDFTLQARQIYTIEATADWGGTIDPSGEVEVFDGDSKTFTITPDIGYEISDVLVDNNSVGAVGSYTFQNVKNQHTIQAVFDEVTVTEPTTVTVAGIYYNTIGGGRHLRITIVLVDDFGDPVSDAKVKIEVTLNENFYASDTGTTNGEGEVTFAYNHAPSGNYETNITNIIADGLIWDSETPQNGYDK